MRVFKFHLLVRTLIVAVFAVGACLAAATSSAGTSSGPMVGLDSSASQASTYRAHCARCHGNDGRSNTSEGRRTEASDLTDESVKNMAADKMARIIRNGKADMPAFGKKLSAAQITSLVRYVRSL